MVWISSRSKVIKAVKSPFLSLTLDVHYLTLRAKIQNSGSCNCCVWSLRTLISCASIQRQSDVGSTYMMSIWCHFDAGTDWEREQLHPNQPGEYTQHEVCVASHNNVSNSLNSLVTVTTDKTMESTPRRGPVIVEAEALTSTSVRVTWTEIPENNQNEPLLYYKVFYTALEEEAEVLSVLVVIGADVYQKTGLLKYTLYSIQLLAYTRIGDRQLCEVPAIRRFLEG